MEAINAFVADARAKGMDDEQIKQLLLTNGWNESTVQVALTGLAVPPPPAAPTPAPVVTTPVQPVVNGRKSISALEAALQHVLLWLFTGASSIMIGIVTVALFGSGGGSSDSLLAYLVVELVTFLPFCLLFIEYLRKLRKENELATGKVWSIITIVFHSIGLISALITLILVLVLVHDSDTLPAVLASVAIAIMDAVVVIAYVLANFGTKKPALRKRLLYAFPAILFVIVAVFGVIALTKVGSLKADDQTKQDLSKTVQAIHSYTQDNHKLPESLSQVNNAASDVTYTRISFDHYKVCGTFKHDNQPSYASSGSDNYDDYVSDYTFDYHDKGTACWTFMSSVLMNNPDTTYYPQSSGASVIN